MIVRLLLAALAAGLIAGMAMTPAQYVRLVPLIIQAEAYESGEIGHFHSAEEAEAAEHSHDVADDHGGEDASMFGFGRLGDTIVANLVAGAGFGLMLGAVALLAGLAFPAGREGVVRGVLLGAAGWFSVQMAPAFSMAPELPGFPYADLYDRQYWWMATVVFSGAGVWLLAMRREWIANLAGLALIAAPHVWGAPRPEDIESQVPALLASEYATVALATTLFFWLLLGGLLGFFLSRALDEKAA